MFPVEEGQRLGIKSQQVGLGAVENGIRGSAVIGQRRGRAGSRENAAAAAGVEDGPGDLRRRAAQRPEYPRRSVGADLPKRRRARIDPALTTFERG